MEFSYQESGEGFLVRLQYQQQKISSFNTREGITEGITEGGGLLLEEIRNMPGRRIPQLTERLKIPQKTIERWIAELKRQGLIEYRGSKRTGGYYGVSKG